LLYNFEIIKTAHCGVPCSLFGPDYTPGVERSVRISDLDRPAMATVFDEDVCPAMICTSARDMRSLSATRSMTARFAFPPTAGADTWQRML